MTGVVAMAVNTVFQQDPEHPHVEIPLVATTAMGGVLGVLGGAAALTRSAVTGSISAGPISRGLAGAGVGLAGGAIAGVALGKRLAASERS